MRRAPWPYRALLRLLPPSLREKHGAEMERSLLEALDREPGGRGGVGFWSAAALDVARAAGEARSRRRRRRSGHGRRRGGGAARVGQYRNEGGAGVEGWIQDLRFAARSLLRRPAFTIVAVVTLALGIGANATIFSVLHGVLLEPLPYADSDRLALIWHDLGNGAQSLPAVNFLDVYDYRERSQVFEEWSIATGQEQILGSGDDAQLVDVGMVESNFLPMLGVEPLLGRHFRPEEDVPGGPALVILSHELWQARFGGDSDIIGRILDLNGEAQEVVGVLPPGFRVLLPAEAFRFRHSDVWRPARLDVDRALPRNYTGYTAFGRIRQGATWEQAQADMDRLEAELKAEHEVHQASNLQVRVVPLHHDVVKRARTGLWTLMTAVGFVLMIACANVAHLLMARGQARRREMSLRAALGAGRRSLSRLVLAESLLLSLTGAVVGTLLAAGALEVLSRLASSSVPRMEGVSLDGTVLAFATLVCVGSALLFGAAPALQVGRTDVATALADGGRAGESRGQGSLRRLLIMGEVALSLILLVGTGLTIRSFVALHSVEPGFDAQDVLTFRISIPRHLNQDPGQSIAFREGLRERLVALPDVRSLAFTSQLPLTGSGTLQPYAYDEETARNWESVTADERGVSPGYFDAMGASLVSGREFEPTDLDGPPVIIIDELLAEQAFPGRDAVGERLQVEPNGAFQPYAQVVGVVRHLKLHDLTQALHPQIWTPLGRGSRVSVAIRTTGDPERLMPQIRREVAAMGAGIPVEDVASMSDIVAAAMAQARLSLVLMSLFGAVAVTLACIGLYGVISFSVSRRTREFGIRMALGAEPGRIRGSVLRDGARLFLPAAVGGLAGAALLSRFLGSLLYGVNPLDPATYAVVVAVLGAVAGVACWVPARRATHIEPTGALSAE